MAASFESNPDGGQDLSAGPDYGTSVISGSEGADLSLIDKEAVKCLENAKEKSQCRFPGFCGRE